MEINMLSFTRITCMYCTLDDNIDKHVTGTKLPLGFYMAT